MSESKDEIDRLADAIDAFLDRDGSPGESRSSFLSRNAAVRDLLEPMLDEPEEEAATDRPSRIGPYRIHREIGRGGMGVVYEAEHSELGRRVALKILPMLMALSPRRIERFRREARAIARLEHPNVVRVHDVGEYEGTWYLSMDLIKGRSLRDAYESVRARCQRDPRRLPPGPQLDVAGGRDYVDEVAELVRQLAKALQHSHENGVVHRDVKPPNVILDEGGKPLLLDFGLAKELEEDSFSLTGDFAGTPHYAAPEQILADGRDLDGRADVFALGVMLYELLAMRRPFDAATSEGVLRAVVDTEPRSLRAFAPDVPRDLETIVLRCLEKSPDKRYLSAAALAEDLRRFRAHEKIKARRSGALARVWRWAGRHRGAAAAAMLAVLLFVPVPIAGWLWSESSRREIQHQRDVADQQRTVAAAQRDLARERLMNSWKAVDLFFSRFIDQREWSKEEFAKFRTEFLEDAREYYEALLSSLSAEEEGAWESGMAHLQVGRVSNVLGRHREALPALTEAVDVLSAVAGSQPDNLASRESLGVAFFERGVARQFTGDQIGRDSDLARAYDLCSELADALAPQDPRRVVALQNLVRVQVAWADLLSDRLTPAFTSRLAIAEQALAEIVAVQPDLIALDLDRAALHLIHAEAAFARRDDADVVKRLGLIREELSRNGLVGSYRGRLLEARGMTLGARLLSAQGLADRARRAWQRAIDLWENRWQAFSNNQSVFAELLSTLTRAAQSATVFEQFDDAVKIARRALECLDEPSQAEMLRDRPGNLRAEILDILGTALSKLDPESSELQAVFEEAIELRRESVQRMPARASALGPFGGTLSNYAAWLLATRDRELLEKACVVLDEAIAVQRRARELDRDTPAWINYLATHIGLRAECHLRMGEAELASDLLHEAAEITRDQGWRQVQLAYGQFIAGRTLRSGEAAQRAVDRCVGNLEAAVQADSHLREQLRADQRFTPLRDHPRFKELMRDPGNREGPEDGK